MRFLGLLLVLAAAASAGEYAVFASGSRMRVERHENDGSKVRLYSEGAVIELNAVDIVGYEAEERVATAPAVAASPAPREAAPAPSPVELADAAADKYWLPRSLVRSVMAAESGFRQEAVSPKGAIGLMQLMPATARTLGVDPRDPAQNVDAGVRYLRDLLLKYDLGLRHALAAYNAGPEAVSKYKGIPPYAETINYVVRIENAWKKSAPPPQ